MKKQRIIYYKLDGTVDKQATFYNNLPSWSWIPVYIGCYLLAAFVESL